MILLTQSDNTIVNLANFDRVQIVETFQVQEGETRFHIKAVKLVDCSYDTIAVLETAGNAHALLKEIWLAWAEGKKFFSIPDYIEKYIQLQSVKANKKAKGGKE